MEMSNLKPHLEVTNYCIQGTVSSADRKNPPKLVPYRNDICMLSNCEDENSSPPHLLPEIIVTRTKLSKVSASPRLNADCDSIKIVPEIEVTKTKLKANISSSCTRTHTENILSVSQIEGNVENRALKTSGQVLTMSANALSNSVLNKNNADIADELHSGAKMVNAKQKMSQLNVKLQKSPEVNSLVRNDVKQHMKAHDKSKVIREKAASLWDQSSCSNEDEPADIVQLYSQKCTKKVENESKLATETKGISNINYRKSLEASILISLSKEKRKSILEGNIFSYPQCRLPKMLDLNNTQQVGSSSTSNGCIAMDLNQNEQGSISNFSTQNGHYESAADCDLSKEQIAKSICNDLVNKAVKKCDYSKSSKCLYFKQTCSQWQPYCPSGNIWVAAHDELKKNNQKVAVVKKQHVKTCSMQSILKSKQQLSKNVVPKDESATVPDIHLLCLGPNDLKLNSSNSVSQNPNFSGKQSATVGKDSKNLAAVEIIESNIDKAVTESTSSKYSLCSSKGTNGQDVNCVQFEAEKVGSCKTKSPSSPVEPQNSNSKDDLMTVDSFGRNLLLGCNTSWPGNMEPSFSGGRKSYMSSISDYWSEMDEDEDDEEEEDDKGDEYLNLKQRITTGKEERDTIDGVEFLAFESERDMVEFTKIEQDIQCNSCCDQGTNSDDGLDMMDDSFNSCGDHDAGSIHQAIVPTKTKDITKIKGWRNKHFAVNNNPSHCINSNNSNGPYEDDDGFESLDVKIQDEVIVEEEPESSIENKENRDLEDQQPTSVQSLVKTNVCCDDEVMLESKDGLLQPELNTDEKIKKAAFVSDEAEKFFSEFVSPEIVFDVPQFKQEEITECLPTSDLMHLSPRLHRLPPRKPVTFWRKGLKCKTLTEKKMLMAMKSNVDSSNSSKRKVGRPRKRKRPRGRPRIHPVTRYLTDQRPQILEKQLMPRRKLVSASSYELDPDYKYTWVAGKPIRITGSKKQMLKKCEDKAQKFESSHIKENNTSEDEMHATQVLTDKLDISGTVDMKLFSNAESKENMKTVMKLHENKEHRIEAIQPAEEFSPVENIKPTSSLKMLEETKFSRNKALTAKKLCSASVVKLIRNHSTSEENKSSSYMKMTEQLESSRNSNLVKVIQSPGDKNAIQEVSTVRNVQLPKESKSKKNSRAAEQVKSNNIAHATEGQNKEVRMTANKLDVFKQMIEELENRKSQLMENAIQKTEKKEKNKQDICDKNYSPLEPQISLPKCKRTQMLINPCIGTPLHPIAIKTLMMVRSKNTLIDETWAKFAVSVVTSSACLSEITKMKNSMPECRKSSFTNWEEKQSDSSAKMKTRGIKAVNYKENTRITCQSEALKKQAKIPVSGVVTRKRYAAMSESSRGMFVTDTDEETNEQTKSKNVSALHEPYNEFSSKMNNAEETKKVSVPAYSKQLATLTGAFSRTLGPMLPKTSKGNEDMCSSSTGSQKTFPMNETDSNSSVKNECITSVTNRKEELNAHCSNISNEKDFTVIKTTHESTATSKRLAVLIEMCSKTAVCETNDGEKGKIVMSSKSDTLNETCTSFPSDENLLEHKTNSSDSNMTSSPSSVSSSPTHSPLTTDTETDQAISIIKEGNALLDTRNEEKNGIPLCCLVNSKETETKMPDNISVEKQYSISETNSEKEKSLKGYTTLNETSAKVSNVRNFNITSDINNKERLCSSEIYNNANNVGNSETPERDSRESKSPSRTGRKRLYEVNKLFNKEDGDPPKKYKIKENTAFPSMTIVISKLSTASKTSREKHAEKKERFSKIQNSERINLDIASRIEDKDARILSSNIGKEMALRVVNFKEQDLVGTETLSHHVEKNTDIVSSENAKLCISEDLDNEIRRMLDDMVNCVVCHEIQDLVIKDDPDGCSVSQLITSYSPKKYRRKTKLNRELSRLSANLIVMNEYEVEKGSAAVERQMIMNCRNDFCRLGCICNSLIGNDMSALPDHCGKPSCMFECSCSNRMIQNDKASREEFGDANHSRLYRTAVHLLDQGSRHLAKVEKEFSRTVIHSGKETVVVGGGSISDGGRRRREIKLPERYRDYNVAIGKEFALAEFKMISTETTFNTGSNDTYRALPNYVEVQVNQTVPTPIRKKPKPLKGKLTLDQKMRLLCERYRIKTCSVRLMRLAGMDDVVPWCMNHAKYECFCRGSSRIYKRLRHPSLERPPPVRTSKKGINDSTCKSVTEMPKVQKKSRNKAIKSTTLTSMHSHDVECYSARTKGATMNYLLRNKSQYFKQKMSDFEQHHQQQQQQQNTSDWNTMMDLAETYKHQELINNPENALTGLLNLQNSPAIMEQTEFDSENVAQDENIGFGKIVSITTLKPEEFEKCRTFEEISETDAEYIIESENPTDAYNPETIANVTVAEGSFEETGINTASEMVGGSFTSSIATNAPNEQIASPICGAAGSGKDSCYTRIAKLISMKKDEIRTLLRKGECSLNLSQYEKYAIQVVKWPVLCRKFRDGQVSIWVHKHGNTSKILITEKELEPDMCSTNLRKYVLNKQNKVPPLIQAMMENLILKENEDKKYADEKNSDAYGLFYCDGETWELVGCMRKIADKSVKQEKESEMNYLEAENTEWPKETELQEEGVCKPVLDATHEALQDNLNELIGIKKEYEHEERSSTGEMDRTLSDFENYVQLSGDSSKNLNVVSEANCLYSPEVYNSDGASHGKPCLIQTQNIEADSTINNTTLSVMGDDLTSVILINEDFTYETKSTEDHAYSSTEIVAFGNKNTSPLPDRMESITLSELLNSEDFKSEITENKQNTEYELQLPKSSFPCRWYVFAIKTPFDFLRFYKHGRNISFKQIKEAIKIANRKHKTIRIPLDNETNPLESHSPKFGTYAVPNILSHFFIGPYEHHEEIGFYALKSYNGMLIDTHVTCAEWNPENERQGIQRNHGMWYYAVKREERENYIDTDSEKAVNPDNGKSMKQILTAGSLEPFWSTGVEAAKMQTESMSKEIEHSSSNSRRKESLTMHSADSMWNPYTGNELSTMNEEREAFQKKISVDANEEEELDVMTPYDVSSMVQKMKDDMQRNTAKYEHERATTLQTFPDNASEGEFKTPPLPLPSPLHQPNDLPRGPGKTAVSVKLVPSIPNLGFISAFMYHNKRMQLINPFADYREVRVFRNLSNLTRWLTCEVKRRVKCFPEDLKLLWRVKQASRNIKNCRAFNPKVLDGTYILTEKGLSRMRKARKGHDPVKNSKKIELRRSFRYLRRKLKAGNGQKLSKLDILQKALEEIRRLVKQKKKMQDKVLYLKQKRLNTFKQFCAQLKGFTTEEKRGAMICLKNVMRRQSIPIVHLDDDDDADNTEHMESRRESRRSAFAIENNQSSDESSIEGYLSDDETDSDWVHQGECSLSCDEVIADKAKENTKENIILISSGGDGEEEDDERPLFKLLQNAEASEFSKHDTLTKNSEDLHKSRSLSHRLNTNVSTVSLSVEEETMKSSEENLRQDGNVSQTDIDDKDSVSITIVREDQPTENAEETENNNSDVVTMTCITQDTENERSVEIIRSNDRDVVTMTYVTQGNENERSAEGLKSEQNRSVEITSSNNREVVTMTYVTQDNENERSAEALKSEENRILKGSSYDKNCIVTSASGINEMQFISTQSLHTTPGSNENTMDEDKTNGSNQENAIFVNLPSDKEKDKPVSETKTSSTMHTLKNVKTFGANQQFVVNGIPVTTASGGICYMMPPLLGQRSSLSLAVGSKHTEQQRPVLKRVWVKENSLLQNGEKIKQTSSERSQKVRIITAPEDWKEKLITASAGVESKKSINTTKVTYVNASGNIQTPQSLTQKIGSKTVSVPMVPAVVLPNNNATSKTGYHLLTRGGTNFKIVQKHKKVDIEFPLATQSSTQSKVSPQIGVTKPIRIVPAASLRSMTDPGQQNTQEGTKQVIKLKSLAGIERPNQTSQLKSVLINGQKVFVQNAEKAYPLLVASSNPSGRPSTLLSSSPAFSTVVANKSENSADSSGLSDTAKSTSESSLNSAPKTLLVSCTNYSNVLKPEVMRTANRCSLSPVSSLQTGSKAFWIKRRSNKPLMLKVVNTKTSIPVSSAPSSMQESDSPSSLQESSVPSSVQESAAPLSVQGRSNIFQAVSFKCVKSSSMPANAEVSKDSDGSASFSEIGSGSETDSSNLKCELLNNDASVSQLNTEDKESEIISDKSEVLSNDRSVLQLSTKNKEAEIVSDKCLNIPTHKEQDMCRSTETNVAKCITPNNSATSKSKVFKLDATDAKTNMKVKDGVATRCTKEITFRIEGMTTRSSKAKQVKS